MASVTVRAFAGLREVVGGHRTLDADSVAEVLAALTEQHGEAFTSRMARAQVVVDDEIRPHDDREPLPDGVEVVLLPPFAGG